MAMKFQQMHCEVLAVDHDEDRVNDVLPYVTNAQIGDSTNEQFIASLGVRNFDVCVVAIGDNFQSSLETTSLLKEQGARFVVARASRDVHAKFLLRNGADDVVYPEKQMAIRTAGCATATTTCTNYGAADRRPLHLRDVHPRVLGRQDHCGAAGCASATTSTFWR